MSNQQTEAAQLLDIWGVTTLVARKRSSIYNDIAKGEFPRPIRLGGCSRWVKSEIEGHVRSLMAKRDAEVALS